MTANQVERVEFPGDGADSAAVTVVRRDHPTWGREVAVGPAVFGVAGESRGPGTLRDLAAALEFAAVWLEADGGGSR